jgi:hypothetical protein
MGLIYDIATCAVLLGRIEREANEILSNLGSAVNVVQVPKSKPEAALCL